MSDDEARRAKAQRNCDLINQMLGGWFSQGAPLKEGMPGTNGPGPEAPSSMEKLSAGELTEQQAAQINAEGGVMTIAPKLSNELERQELMEEARRRRLRKRKLR